MTLNFHALWTLTGLGAIVFAACATPSRRGHATLGAGFCVAAGWGLWRGVPSPEAVGLVTAIGALLQLLRPSTSLRTPLLAGVLAGVWGVMLGDQGVAPWLALPAGAAWLAATVVLQPRAGFAPARVRDEALLVVAICGLVVAMMPGVIDGWHAAVNLSLQSSETPVRSLMPGWTLAVGVTSLTLGAAYSFWSRR